MPDTHLARRMGCHCSYIVRWRQTHGVPKYDKLEGFLELLGYSPDWEVAQLAGVTTRYVRERRVRAGIALAAIPLHKPKTR